MNVAAEADLPYHEKEVCNREELVRTTSFSFLRVRAENEKGGAPPVSAGTACLLAIAAIGASGPASAAESSVVAPSFEAAVERNLAAVEARDYDGLLATVTEGDRLLLIFPNGHLTHSRAEYLEFHRQWFADRRWTMTFERIAVDVAGDYGHALYRTTYDADGNGPEEPRSSYLTLGFRLENGRWRLVHDQNTRIAPTQ